MNNVALHSIELCAGVGMLGEGVSAAFEFLGLQHRTVAYVEREAAAAAQLVTLMEAGIIDPAPVWSDLTTFNGAEWRGKVDCLIAGFPCQDISIAGRRAGLDGSRSGLFFNILDIADDSGAELLILENVSAITTAPASVVDPEEGELIERAASRIMGELADRGWNTEWVHVPASGVGASHKRERWFCLAWRSLEDAGSIRRGRRGHGNPPGYSRALQTTGRCSGMADPKSKIRRSKQQAGAAECRRTGSSGEGRELADTCQPGCQGCEQCRALQSDGGGQEAHGSTEQLCGALPFFAPGPTDERWPGIIEQFPGLAPATEPGVCMLADGLAMVVDTSRGHQLRQTGNGVVPLQAATAIIVLFQRAGLIPRRALPGSSKMQIKEKLWPNNQK